MRCRRLTGRGNRPGKIAGQSGAQLPAWMPAAGLGGIHARSHFLSLMKSHRRSNAAIIAR